MDAATSVEIWTLWWVWGLGAVVLLVLEVFAPGFLFLGFGAGATVVAALLGLGVAPENPALLAFIFAVVSMAAWYAMRVLFGVRKGQVKVWDKDINDDV
jgi:membrane protein implicated in regulation of membrane protease activity